MSDGWFYAVTFPLLWLLAFVLFRVVYRAGAVDAAKRMHDKNYASGRWSPTARDIANELLRELDAADEVEGEDDDENEDDDEDDQ